MHIKMNLQTIFTPNGLISQLLREYEYRPQQLQMAEAVAKAFESNEHLVVEAGTGVGKSFAYLIPAVDFALESGEKALVSTNTISLQEQLINKDIPFLQKILPQPFNAVLVKGRGNYLCLRRLDSLFAFERGLFDTSDEAKEVNRILNWSRDTKDGSLADINPLPMPSVWDRVVSESDNCLSVACNNYKECFYFKARAKMKDANLLIVNHHLLFSDLALRKIGPALSILPSYSHLVLDEAQHIESVATEHTGIKLSNHRVKKLLDSLCNPKRSRGLLLRLKAINLIGFVNRVRDRANDQFGMIEDWMGNFPEGTKRIERKGFVPNLLKPPLVDLEEALKTLRGGLRNDDEEKEVDAHIRRCVELRKDLDEMLNQNKPEFVYWIECAQRRRYVTISLNAAPINVSDDLRACLFEKTKSIILTSATLSTNRDFEYFKSRIGLGLCLELLVGSPFDYEQQVCLYVSRHTPDPRSYQFIPAAIEQIKKFLILTHGKAFVLFTSYKMMDEVYESLAPYLDGIGIASFKQGAELSRHSMIEAFKEDINSVIFGTASFWEGVDVRGEALSNVIIVKLPFAVPTHPVTEARFNQIEKQGGNAFMEYSLPEAIIRLKQGFGRLIRNKTDEGIVVILDPRVLTKPYGRQFLNSLPECRVIEFGNREY